MIVTLYNVQVGHDNGIVQSGCHLGNAAAGNLLEELAYIGFYIAVACLGGQLTQSGVEGELLAGSDDGAVDGVTGQLQIGNPVFVAADDSLEAGQQVLEQLAGDGLTGDAGHHVLHGDGDHTAVFGVVHLGLQVLQCKAVAEFLRGDLVCKGVDGGIFGSDAQLIPDGLIVQGCGRHHRAFAHNLENVDVVGIQNLLIKLSGHKAVLRSTQIDVKCLVGGLRVHIAQDVHGGTLTLYLPAGLGKGSAVLHTQVADSALDIRGIQAQIG